jgi:hypothetical protein
MLHVVRKSTAHGNSNARWHAYEGRYSWLICPIPEFVVSVVCTALENDWLLWLLILNISTGTMESPPHDFQSCHTNPWFHFPISLNYLTSSRSITHISHFRFIRKTIFVLYAMCKVIFLKVFWYNIINVYARLTCIGYAIYELASWVQSYAISVSCRGKIQILE